MVCASVPISKNRARKERELSIAERPLVNRTFIALATRLEGDFACATFFASRAAERNADFSAASSTDVFQKVLTTTGIYTARR
jgi:hypothetical protein